MPSLRGIEISIVASSDIKRLPEYPHPDGSSVRLTRVGPGCHDLRDKVRNGSHFSSSKYPNAEPTLKKSNPRVSVYIPSSPGSQFRLKYLIHQPAPPSRFVFFKMIINGHPTVSWGIDTIYCASGTVSKSLFEPGDGLRDKNGNIPIGIETRYFHFVHGLDQTLASEDGGLIEVQVFRCRGRKRIAVELDPYSHLYQERRGITSSSGGLVDNPQDATFYEYHLEDAKDSPFATFCFYYRSVQYLVQRNLIPKYETGFRPASLSSNNSSGSDSRENPARATSPSAHQLAIGVEFLEDNVFEDHINPVSMAISDLSEVPKVEEYSLRSPPQLAGARQPATAIEDVNKAKRDAFLAKLLQRPLPELPKTSSRQASKSSLRSSCPSLTPSLKRYVKSEEFENEEIKLGTAQSILLPSAPIKALELRDINAYEREDESSSDYAASLDSTEASHSPALPSPTGYVPTTGSVLERHLNQFDSPIAQSSPKSKARLPLSKSQVNLLSDLTNMAEPKPSHLERTAAEPRDESLHIVTLTKVDEINDQIRLFRLELSAPLRFLPGQWLDVFVPGVSKAGGYTITSPPSLARPHVSPGPAQTQSPGYVELAVQKSVDPPAAWLWQNPDEITYAELRVRVGGSFVWPPVGIDAHALRRVVFVAGGVGINPLMSMLSSIAETGADAPFQVQFLYSLKDDDGSGGRRADRLQFVQRLAGIFASGRVKGRLRLFLTGGSGDGGGVVHCLGEGEEGGESDVPFQARRMTVDDIAVAVGDAEERKAAVVYVCSVPTMTDEFVLKLTDMEAGLGMESHRVLCEKWW
ncbi:Oxidoreductase NAD-binding domain-containing protein 1 [Daldinia childiae]|uniref:Oxidoreductase NAD-binding domain-containing protein 1 n=1 Tax=Daldinia childiae TaxID=326645 RepID=UPI0014462D32|nr:Oxidoreductase NAD-binding domain-containing protein 1 [Daldinia childiae]KAF3061695.1 Oxidoreductase NAD-binding domain-containing protein 1 [Daldinia childiae]